MGWIQDTGKQEAANVDNLAFSFVTLPQVGNFIGVGSSIFAGGLNGAVTVTDNNSNVYTKDVERTSGFTGAAINRTVVQTSSGTFTITIDGAGNTGNYITGGAAEYNQVGSGLLDRTTSNISTTTSSVTTGATSIMQKRTELVLTALCVATNSTTCNISLTTGFTTIWLENDAANFSGGMFAYKIERVCSTQQGNYAFNTVDAARVVLATYYLNMSDLQLVGVGV